MTRETAQTGTGPVLGERSQVAARVAGGLPEDGIESRAEGDALRHRSHRPSQRLVGVVFHAASQTVSYDELPVNHFCRQTSKS